LTALEKIGDFSERGARTTRLETFVDAAFAFALTMLIISGESVPRSHEELVAALKGIPAFAASFALIVMFWHGHYRWSRRYGLEDGVSVLLSLLLVFTVLVFFYPLKMMMFGAFATFTGGALPSPIQFRTTSELIDLFGWFAFGFTTMCGLLGALFYRATQLPLAVPLTGIERIYTSLEVQIWFAIATLGVLSALIAAFAPGRWVGLAPWAYSLASIIAPVLAMRAHSRAAKLRNT
jgi:hypothetical protein